MDSFTRAYVKAALSDSTDNSTPSGGYPLDRNYSAEKIAPETISKMEADCTAFQEKAGDVILEDIDRAAADFWLTRNGAGSGFWDGDWEEEDGERLADLAHEFGTFNLYVGDDGLIYGSS